jgi:hypothetical protein
VKTVGTEEHLLTSEVLAAWNRLEFATDYPYRPGPEGGVESFLDSTSLDRAAKERIAAGNWEALSPISGADQRSRG